MRRLALPLACLAALTACDGEKVVYDSDRYDITWIRIGGATTIATDDIPGATGVYGTLGVGAATNQPGARTGSVSWLDEDGVAWLFGGTGYDANGDLGRLNDLWKYDGTNWTWMGGSSLAGGTAVYGTEDVADTGNLPGARNLALAWTDADGTTLWLFGGNGLDAAATQGRLQDLWRYDTEAGTWTWVGGSNTVNVAGVYGTSGTADPANWPGSRHSAAGWVNDDGTLWLFGGNGLDATGGCCWLNDLWQYDPDTGQWTWRRGSDSANAPAVYLAVDPVEDDPDTPEDETEPGVPDEDVTPGGRFGAVAWHVENTSTTSESSEAAWLFAGTGNDADGNRVVFNEMWRFDGENWTFALGDKGKFGAGSYGGRGVFAFNNLPPSRHRPMAWNGITPGSFYMFGGAVEATENIVTYPNDLWRWDFVGWTWLGGLATDNPAGTYPENPGELGQPGGRDAGTGWVDELGNLWLFGGGSDGARNDLWVYNILNGA